MDAVKKTEDLKAAQRTTLFISMFAALVFPFAASSLNPAIPSIGEDFPVPATSLAWIISAMLLANISISVPIGRFADLWGKRRVFNIGICIFSVATLLNAFAPNFWVLLIFRVFQGIGGAMFATTNIAILMDIFPAQQRGRILGLTVMCTYLGLSVGPVLGGLIVNTYSWRGIFIVTAAMAIIVCIVALTSMSKLPKSSLAHEEGTLINPVSNVLYMSAMFVFMYGLTILGQNSSSYFFLGGGVLLFIVFVWHELRSSQPVIELRLFKGNLNFIFSNLSAMLNYAATGAIGYILIFYLETIRGFQPLIAGLILIVQPVIMAVVSPFMGRLSDKHSPFIFSSIGMGICSLAMLLFLFLSEGSPLGFVIVCLVVVGFGFGFFSSPNTNAIMSSVSPKDFGVANSILSTMRISGQLISLAVITIVLNFYIGNAPLKEADTAGIMSAFHTTFVIFALLCLCGVLLSLGRKQKPLNEEP